MILTLIIIAIVVLSSVLLHFEKGEEIASLTLIISSACLILVSIVIICAHVGVNNQLRKYEIEYQSLIERKEIISSDYEDVSRSDVINDISEWNKDVQDMKYWGNNPWTSLFYSRRVVDELKFIE